MLPELAQADNDIHKIFPMILIIRNKIITMKSLLSSKRSKAILGIVLIAIGIGAISKKVISLIADKSPTNISLFVRINYAELSKKLNIA